MRVKFCVVFLHVPNIVISDIPHMKACHTNKQHADLFKPFHGRVVEATDEIVVVVVVVVVVALAQKGSFLLCLIHPWIAKRYQKAVEGVVLNKF